MNKMFTLISILLTSLAINAQTVVTFGIKAGANASTVTKGLGSLSAELFKDPNYKIGLAAGVFVNLAISKNFSLQPEIVFSQEGYVQDGKIGTADQNSYVQIYKSALNYLNIPIMFRYSFNNGFYMEVGTQIGFLLNKKLEIKSIEPDPYTLYTEGYLKNRSIGAGAGVGFKFKNGFGLGARYVFGLSAINELIGMKGNTFHFGAHYQFSHK
jgi:Outer membrane protein beta-barrel domain